jgi:hypothetical protein
MKVFQAITGLCVLGIVALLAYAWWPQPELGSQRQARDEEGIRSAMQQYVKDHVSRPRTVGFVGTPAVIHKIGDNLFEASSVFDYQNLYGRTVREVISCQATVGATTYTFTGCKTQSNRPLQ